MERSEGNILKLSISERFPRKDEVGLANILDGHVRNLRSVSFCHVGVLARRLAGQLDSLEEIQKLAGSARFDSFDMPPDPDDPDVYQGFEPSHSTLRRISLRGAFVDFKEKHEIDQNVRCFEMNEGILQLPQASLVPVAERFSNLVRLELDGVHMKYADSSIPSTKISLDKLTTLRITGACTLSPPSSVVQDFFNQVSTPHLLHLDVSEAIRDLGALFLAPGLAPSLVRLQSLDLFNINLNVNQNETTLVDNLRLMPQLRFLNVSGTILGDSFLEAITRDCKRVTGDGQAGELLPNLVALSIAALDITSLALRDFAVSRLPKIARSESASAQKNQTQTQAVKSSAFRPTSSTSTRPTSFSQASPIPTSQSGSQPKSGRASAKRYLKWLCLDHCETIDHQLIEYLRTKIMFVSAGRVPNDDRMKGRGRYHWDLDYYDSCIADDPKENCKLVLIPGEWLVGVLLLDSASHPSS